MNTWKLVQYEIKIKVYMLSVFPLLPPLPRGEQEQFFVTPNPIKGPEI